MLYGSLDCFLTLWQRQGCTHCVRHSQQALPVLSQQLAHQLGGLGQRHIVRGEHPAHIDKGLLEGPLKTPGEHGLAPWPDIITDTRELNSASDGHAALTRPRVSSSSSSSSAHSAAHLMMCSSLTAGRTCSASATSAGLLTCVGRRHSRNIQALVGLSTCSKRELAAAPSSHPMASVTKARRSMLP
jgi:hypothetical protein